MFLEQPISNDQIDELVNKLEERKENNLEFDFKIK